MLALSRARSRAHTHREKEKSAGKYASTYTWEELSVGGLARKMKMQIDKKCSGGSSYVHRLHTTMTITQTSKHPTASPLLNTSKPEQEAWSTPGKRTQKANIIRQYFATADKQLKSPSQE